MRTRVELRHGGFERLGPHAARMRRAYPLGWAYVLGLYAQRRGPFIVVMKALTSTLMAVARLRRRRAARGTVQRSASGAEDHTHRGTEAPSGNCIGFSVSQCLGVT